MNKFIQSDHYGLNIKHQKITIGQLLEHYDLEKVEGYCKACPNYDKIWSCPPFDFSPKDYLRKFSTAIIYSGEIIFDQSIVKIDERHQLFNEGRKKFGNLLVSLENDYNKSEALIAGHCFLCEECSRPYGKKCFYPKKIRYSLEAMGIEVGNLLSKVLNQKLSWEMKPTDPLITVGAILIK